MAQERTSPEILAQLRQALNKYFSDEELHDLCFDMRVEYDDLPGEGRSSKARELLAHLDRQGRIPELISKCPKLSPDAFCEAPEITGNALAFSQLGSPTSSSSGKHTKTMHVGRPSLSIGIAIILSAIFIILAGLCYAGMPGCLPVMLFPITPRATITPPVTLSPTVIPTSGPLYLKGTVCQIKAGWSEETLYVRVPDFYALGLPAGSKVTATVSGSCAATLTSYKEEPEDEELCCTVRLSEGLRRCLGVDRDVGTPVTCDRSIRLFSIAP